MPLDVLTMMEMDTQTMGEQTKLLKILPGFASQWNDSDWDGYGDNINGYQGDACPLTVQIRNLIKSDVEMKPVLSMVPNVSASNLRLSRR